MTPRSTKDSLLELDLDTARSGTAAHMADHESSVCTVFTLLVSLKNMVLHKDINRPGLYYDTPCTESYVHP